MCFCFLLEGIWDLFQNDGDYHEDAAEVLAARHPLQVDGVGDDGEHSPEAQEDSGHHGIGILPCQNLQCIGCISGKYNHIRDMSFINQPKL